ncbi:histidine phosphatase family protein [Metabacillus lacus]|uniref:histidine phosphatase family protein n=1 Tax=Metabacillus lacus TaxID=1983721 RepID=UPI0012B03693
MELLLIRHGKSEAKGRIAGQADFPLSEEGYQQSKMLADLLKSQGLQHIYCSPLNRAYSTAMIISDSLGLDPIPLHELKERDAGVFNGMSRREAIELFPSEWEGAWTDPLSAPPQGETFEDVEKRAENVLHLLLKQHRKEKVAIVSHSGFLNILMLLLMGLEKEQFPLFKFDVGSVTCLGVRRPGECLVNYINRVPLALA